MFLTLQLMKHPDRKNTMANPHTLGSLLLPCHLCKTVRNGTTKI